MFNKFQLIKGIDHRSVRDGMLYHEKVDIQVNKVDIQAKKLTFKQKMFTPKQKK